MAKILVVDDDTTFCIMLKNWLGKRKFEVENAFTCKEAVKKLEGTAFDVVLTDLRLPDKDGIDLLRIIKEKTPQAQVILMTGYADIQTAVTAIKLGAFDYEKIAGSPEIGNKTQGKGKNRYRENIGNHLY